VTRRRAAGRRGGGRGRWRRVRARGRACGRRARHGRHRRYPRREALLEALTLRAFRLVLECAENAENLDEPGLAALSSFLDCVISHADQLILSLHGGPIPVEAETLAARSAVHQALQRILDRGWRDGTIRADVTTRDIIVLTALLAQQLPASRGSDQAPRRLKERS